MLSIGSRTSHLAAALWSGSLRLASSVASGSSNFIAKENVPAFLASRAAEYPDKDVLRVCDQHFQQQSLLMTWSEFQYASDGLASGLDGCRVRFGDSALLLLPSCSENFVTLAALGKAGARSVQVPESSSTQLIERALSSGTRAAFFPPRSSEPQPTNRIEQFLEIIPELKAGSATPVWPFRIPTLKSVVQIGPDVVPGFLSLEECFFYDAFPNPLTGPAARLQDGQSTLASHYVDDSLLEFTHASILNSALAISSRWGLGPDDRILTTLHLDQGQTGQVALFAIFAARGVAIISSAGQKTEALAKNLDVETVTHLLIRPSQLSALFAEPTFKGSSSLKSILIVASAEDRITPSLLEQTTKVFPSVAVSTALSHPAVPGFLLQSKPGQAVVTPDGKVSYGAPADNTTVRIAEGDKVAEHGFEAEIQVQGPILSKAHQGTWLSTGIRAVMKPDGSVSL